MLYAKESVLWSFDYMWLREVYVNNMLISAEELFKSNCSCIWKKGCYLCYLGSFGVLCERKCVLVI